MKNRKTSSGPENSVINWSVEARVCLAGCNWFLEEGVGVLMNDPKLPAPAGEALAGDAKNQGPISARAEALVSQSQEREICL